MKKLVHFVRWEVIPQQEWENVFSQLPGWGVTETVANPIWGKLEREKPGTLALIQKWCKKYHIALPGAHAFWGKGNDLGCDDLSRRNDMLNEHKSFLGQLAELGVKTYTLHLGLSGKSDQWDYVKRSVEALLDTASKNNIVLALENGSESEEELEKLIALADEFDHPNVGYCFDTGHANCYAGRDVEKLLAMMAKRIAVLHLHDNYGSFDDHNPPGGGTVNWETLVPKLHALPRLINPETESGDWSQDSWNAFVKMWNLPFNR